MKFQTMSLLAGTSVCQASCPFCVARMTGDNYKTPPVDIHGRNLVKAINLASQGQVTSVIITGKGEPTLYPQHIDYYMKHLDHHASFPFIELQTNAEVLGKEFYGLRGTSLTPQDKLKEWYQKGMTTIMISNVGYDMDVNRRIYFPKRKDHIDIPRTVNTIHEAGLIVRYTTVGIKGGIDSPEELEKLLDFTSSLGIEQVTWRPVAVPSKPEDTEAGQWVQGNHLTAEEIDKIHSYVHLGGTPLYSLVHGATVYDFKGHNLCISNCLTHEPGDTLRQLIFFPDGRLYTDWQFKGSRLL